jgi:hypothetical protein
MNKELSAIREYVLDILEKQSKGRKKSPQNQAIQYFWEKFKVDDDFIYVVTGKFLSDDLDLEGDGNYFLTGDPILVDMMFNYMTTTLGWDEATFDDNLWNSCELSDEIFLRYERLREFDSETEQDTQKEERGVETMKLVIELDFESWFDVNRRPKTKAEWSEFFINHLITDSQVIGTEYSDHQDQIVIKSFSVIVED